MSSATAARRLTEPAVLFAAAAAATFVAVRPPVGDFFAAQARQYAALHGVGLHYWFSWFGGSVPGHYSVFGPYLLRAVDPGVLGAVSTVASVVIARRLFAGSVHSQAAAWLAAIAASFSLWSGRIPFALGTALMLAALFAVVRGRAAWGGAAAVATTLVSPVSGAFLALGVAGVALHDRSRRRAAAAAGVGAGASLVAIATYFGTPGNEGFPTSHALLAAATSALLLLARPPAAVRTVVLATVVACPLLELVPNGMGTNFERFTWICLPVAVVATGRGRRAVVVAAGSVAVLMGVIGSIHDLYVAGQPMSAPSYTDGLISRLDHIPGLADYRVEVVPDGTHLAAYSLLGHATLARGYETQSDNRQNGVLMSPAISAARYRSWLDENAVAYVALDRRTLSRGPEDKLVRWGKLAYLRPSWSDRHWLLFAVAHPTPVVARPARIVDADPSDLVVSVPQPGVYELRVRWSRFLHLTPAAMATISQDGAGCRLIVRSPGSYSIDG